ncbi:LysR substrate-binding domain-containing protein [Caenispirillum salinarum]|uniref:LysR substrate-binding domain-containing protein n=1 Tax=Caenispirillum salinarum TaxID=859058 RepID=UPI00384E8E32
MSRWDGIDEFVAVAEAGSFRAGAERLRVSSSQVSRQVAALENRLQTRLFYRTTRRVALTDAGRVLLERCQRLVEERDEALRAVVDREEGEPRGVLRMTCAVSYGERFIVPLMNAFLEKHPALHLDIQLTNTTIDLVQEQVDLAVRLGRLTDSGIIATRLAPRVMHLCAAPAYQARNGTPHSLSEIAGHDCLVGTAETWLFDDGGGRATLVRPAGRWRCNSGSAVLDAALRGFGLCQLPDYYVTEHIAAGRLVSLLPNHRPPHTAVWAAYPQRRHLSAKVRLAIEHLKAGLARRPEYAPPPPAAPPQDAATG